MPISIETGGAELLDQLEPHWVALRQHHVELAPAWKAELLSISFDVRRNGLLRKGVNGLFVLLARLEGPIVGYCICTIDADRRGEIDSLYVAEALRGQGIGEALTHNALRWLLAQPTSSIIVKVISGNDGALRFYERLGFRARTVKLCFVRESE